jgi:hypothetical protein
VARPRARTSKGRLRELGVKVDRRLARKVYRIVHEGGDEGDMLDFDDWLYQSATWRMEHTTLHPGRRAVVEDFGLFVTLRWQLGKDGLPYIVSFSAEAPPGEVFNPVSRKWSELPLAEYWAGLVLRLRQEEVAPESAPLPAAGKRPSLDHYRKVLAEYDALVREGHPSPISILEERYLARRGTVKSWLHRGRKYLKEEKS